MASTAEPPEDADFLDTVPLDPVDPGKTLGCTEPEVVATAQALQLADAVRLGPVLGRGGTAVVREAHQIALDRTVAVKSSNQKHQTQEGILLQEARITGALEHPGILPVHDILVDDVGNAHIVMKRIDGLPWGQLMQDADSVLDRFGKSDLLEWNLDVLVAVCHAMEFAHSVHVIHRDLKPDNVMVAAYGQVYVLDWGLAVSTDPEERRFPRASEQKRLSGTPCYMAPEMLTRLGLKQLGPRTDVYLLGAILFQIATGFPPHRGLDLHKILAGIPSFEPEFDGPFELVQIVKRAMAANQEDRFPDVTAFRQAIEAFQAHRGVASIALHAEKSLDRLILLLQDADAPRIEVYDLFGQVRFGFLEALKGWPENEQAAAGLERALVEMSEWELDHGDDRAAEVLLMQLAEVPTGLLGQLDEVRETRENRDALLLRLARRSDPAIGRSLRIFAAALMMVLWTAAPWLNQLAWWVDQFTGVAFLLIGGFVLAVGWRQMIATRRNRVFSGLLLAGLVGNLVLTTGVFFGSISSLHMKHATWMLNGTMALCAALLLHRAFFVVAATYYVGFAFAAQLEPIRPMVSSAMNLLLGATAVYAFLPKRWFNAS